MNALSQLMDTESAIDKTDYLGFPDYVQERYEAPFVLEINLKTDADMLAFTKLIEIECILEEGIRSVKSIWYPELGRGERGSNKNFIWVEE